LKNEPSVSLLAWTTTPWTLPSNLALCVNPNFEYIKIKDEETGSVWILLEKRLEMLYKDLKKAKFTVLEKIKGSDLKGLEYEPLFDYFKEVYSAPLLFFFCQIKTDFHFVAPGQGFFRHHERHLRYR
jgi:isoleucyl-tRNA synthetase